MTPNEALAAYLRSKPPKERIAKSRDIREVCQKSKSVLYDWCHGRTKIRPQWQTKITEALGEDIFTNCNI